MCRNFCILSREPKIRDQDHTIFDQDIFRFEIAMNATDSMKLGQCVSDVNHPVDKFGGFFRLRKIDEFRGRRLEELGEAAISKIENEKEAALVRIAAVEFDAVGMLKET